jgi:AraC-like DNA-binding protein
MGQLSPKCHYDSERWISILESYSSPTLLVDINDSILLVNTAAETLWQSSRDNLQKNSMGDLISNTRDEVEWSRKKQILKESGYYHGLVLIKTKNQSEKLCQLTIDLLGGESRNCMIAQFAFDTSASRYDYIDFVKIKNAINRNIGNVKDIAQLGVGLKLDYRRILYLFKKFEGSTPKQYLKNLKIRKCSEMLRDGQYSLKEIAFELGFYDLSHLCNVFRDEMDMTLNEYKGQL